LFTSEALYKMHEAAAYKQKKNKLNH